MKTAKYRHIKLNRERTIQTLREHLSTLESRFGVRTLSLFGSTSRDERTAESDIDLLDCKVDLATQGTLNSHVSESIERDLITIHAA